MVPMPLPCDIRKQQLPVPQAPLAQLTRIALGSQSTRCETPSTAMSAKAISDIVPRHGHTLRRLSVRND